MSLTLKHLPNGLHNVSFCGWSQPDTLQSSQMESWNLRLWLDAAFSKSFSKQHKWAETVLQVPRITQFITILEAKRHLIAFDLNQCLVAAIHKACKEHMCTIVSRLLTEIHAVASISRQSIMWENSNPRKIKCCTPLKYALHPCFYVRHTLPQQLLITLGIRHTHKHTHPNQEKDRHYRRCVKLSVFSRTTFITRWLC